MKKQLFGFLLFLLTAALIMPSGLLAQTNKPIPPTKIFYSNSSSTNNLESLSPIQPAPQKFSAEKQELLNQLEQARTANDMARKEQIENALNELNGTHPVTLTESPDIHGGAVLGDNRPPFQTQPDYMTATVLAAGIWSSALGTTPTGAPNAGRLWIVTAPYTANASDTCKFFYSDNGGVSWNFAYYFYFGGNMDFRASEMDLEVVYDGTVVWLYGVAGYTDIAGSRTYSVLFRINTGTNVFNGYIPTWPGSATTTNLYYNPHITSDNSNYTGATYIYFTCSFDSTTGGTHMNRQKYAHITTPFAASPTIDYTMGSGNGGFWWNTSGVPAGTYLWTDIAYFRTATSANRILTVYNVPGSSNYNLYLAYTDDYGATVGGSSSISETNIDYGARIEFNAGATNLNGMIAYVRQFSGTDWDPYYRATIDGGTTWAGGYIDGSSNRTRSVDIKAIRGGANIFKVGYVQDSATSNYAFYTGGSGALGFSQPSRLAISGGGADSTYTKSIAGYKLGGGDDCIALFSTGAGTNLYASRLCQTTVGINENNNGIPKVFSLAQNYPNPFNPSTDIKFSLPKQSFVSLKIYDALGKLVKELAGSEMSAGNYSITFDASNYPSGVYFYKLQAGDFNDTKKMILIK